MKSLGPPQEKNIFNYALVVLCSLGTVTPPTALRSDWGYVLLGQSPGRHHEENLGPKAKFISGEHDL